ncbi:MAG: hypothetical protein U1F30_08525 [Steroidobacteraceae bacterium]
MAGGGSAGGAGRGRGPARAQQQQAIQPACEVLAGLKLPHASVASAQNAPAESLPPA